LTNASVVITGCSSGIGAELALQYSRLGARLVIAARRRTQLEQVANECRAAGAASVLAIPTDMTDREQVERLLHRAAAAFDGRIDVLMLNHAAVDDGLVFEYNSTAALEAGLQSVLHANVVGSAIATRVALPYLEAAGGTVAVVSSASTIAPAPFHAAYVASKRALHGWFDTFRHELHLVGSRVAVQLQVLGMIGTPAIMKDPGNHRLAISVEECASAMICAAQGKWCVARLNGAQGKGYRSARANETGPSCSVTCGTVAVLAATLWSRMLRLFNVLYPLPYARSTTRPSAGGRFLYPTGTRP
jgi:short-subunit dehydrogenase